MNETYVDSVSYEVAHNFCTISEENLEKKKIANTKKFDLQS